MSEHEHSRPTTSTSFFSVGTHEPPGSHLYSLLKMVLGTPLQDHTSWLLLLVTNWHAPHWAPMSQLGEQALIIPWFE